MTKEKDFQKTERFQETYNNLERALKYRKDEIFIRGERLEGILCVEDIPQIMEPLSQDEGEMVVNTLAKELPKQVSFGMDYIDGAHHNLRLARLAKYFDTEINGKNWRYYFFTALNDFNQVRKDPDHYKVRSEIVDRYVRKTIDEFGVENDKRSK